MTEQALPASPRHSLFDRKLKLMERLNCADLFTELETHDAQIDQLNGMLVDYEMALRQSQAAVEEIEVLAALGIEGKNDTERKAKKLQLMRADEGWQMSTEAVLRAQGELARLNAELDTVKRRARRTEKRIAYHVAILNFLGGAGE